MNKPVVILLLGLGACIAQAAESPAAPEAPDSIRIFRGQWTFMSTSTAFCAEQVPTLKNSLREARGLAEEQMAKAEAIVLEETADSREGYKPYFDQYASMWSRYAGELLAAVKRQDPGKACPDLLANWQAVDADLILEDWHDFVERNGPAPRVESANQEPHSASR